MHYIFQLLALQSPIILITNNNLNNIIDILSQAITAIQYPQLISEFIKFRFFESSYQNSRSL